MSQPVSEMMTLLCKVVHTVPIGTNLALLHVLWRLVNGHLLVSRGAIIPGLYHTGLSKPATLRAWQALRRGGWTIGALWVNWEVAVTRAGRWQPRYHGGYCAVAIDTTGFWRPRLKNCPTTHYDHRACWASWSTAPAPAAGLRACRPDARERRRTDRCVDCQVQGDHAAPRCAGQ